MRLPWLRRGVSKASVNAMRRVMSVRTDEVECDAEGLQRVEVGAEAALLEEVGHQHAEVEARHTVAVLLAITQ